MRKFTLPAGTTNRHQWHKDAAKAVRRVTQTFNMLRQLYGQHGGEEHESLVSVFGGGLKNPEAVKVYEALGERFDWQITRENAAEVAEAFREALPACMATVPVEDNRTTPEQDAERAEICRKAEAERKAKAEAKSERVEALAAELRKQYPHAIGPDSGKSRHARAAANLKAILQARGLRCSVKSESFSMGNSVHADIMTPDLPPEVRKEIDGLCQLFRYGTFDPMTDYSDYDHSDEGEAWELVNGRAKYCRASYEQSDENRAAIAAFLGTEQDVHQVWSGVHPRAEEFWQQWAKDHATPTPAAPVQGAGYSIQKHHHSKRGFDFWLVVLDNKVERAEFEQLRDSCKAAGGWYSRKWGSTPGGFAFKEREQAGAWAVQEFGGDDTPPDDGARPHPDVRREKAIKEVRQGFRAQQGTERAAKFRTMAEKLAEEVAAKRGDHRENTPKQQREGMSRRIEADRLERTAQALEALADLIEAGEVPPLLAKFTSKKAIYEALRTRTTSGGYYHIADTGEHADESPEAAALWQLIDGKDPEQEQADRLRDMRANVKGRKIPGYFPTPPDIVAEMLDRAQIETGHLVLEPSAGCGAILDGIEELHAEPVAVVVYEVNSTLCEILRAKGYDAMPADFLGCDRLQQFDRIVMNPPFEKLQDVEHVRHAFRLLKPGGRLVAIMSPGPFFHDTSKARQFREWFEELAGEVEEIEPGAFKSSGTGVAARLVVIDRPEDCDTCGAPAGEIHPRACADFTERAERLAMGAPDIVPPSEPIQGALFD